MSLQNKRALTVLVSWLEAAKVPFTITGAQALTVSGKSGEFPVEIVSGRPTIATQICAKDLVAPLDKALEIFWVVTEKAGFGRPKVVDRGPAPDRVKHKDDPELVAMRHREFRQVPNLPDHVYKDPNYQKIITWYCLRFFRGNQQLCQHVGYEVDDIKTYAWLYLTNFYGRWRHVDKGTGKGEYGNGKMFCSYLQQRLYSDLKPLLVRKSKNIVVDTETAELGTNIEYVAQYAQGEDGASMVAVGRPQEQDPEQMLEEMEHDAMISLLELAVERQVSGAQKRLTDHRSGCLECSHGVSCYEQDLRI